MTNGWHKEQKPRVDGVGPFESVIVATAKGTEGKVSACAWDLSIHGRAEILADDGWPSGDNDSSHERGYIGAAIGAVDACAENSTLTIHCGLQNLVNTVCGKNSPRENNDMWDRLFRTAKRKGISLKACHLDGLDERLEARRIRLMVRARKEADQRITELST